MGFSHRDLRAARAVREGFWVVLALVGAVSVLSVVASSPLFGLVTLLGLAAIGGGYLAGSDRVLREYANDLRRVQQEDPHGWLGAEAGHAIELDRTIGRRTQRSPHTRPTPASAEPVPVGAETEP